MRSLLKLVVAAAALSMTAGAACAADMPARGYTKAPYIDPVYNWSGFYAGLNAGYGSIDTGPGGGDLDGFVGGGQIGVNWQFNQIVLGLEADFQGTDINASATAAGFTGSVGIDYIGTVRGRVGYAWDRVMIYATGGYAYGNVSASLVGPGIAATGNTDFDGAAYGGGVEWAFAPNWTAKVEYLHFDLDLNIGGGGDFDADLVRVGVNYKFGGWR